MKYLYFLIALLVSIKSFAQKQIVFFMRDNGTYVSTKDSADFIRIIKPIDAGGKLYSVRDYYTNGKGKMEALASKTDAYSLEGKCSSFYRNGSLKQVLNYKRGILLVLK
jgi:hypothetical protein